MFFSKLFVLICVAGMGYGAYQMFRLWQIVGYWWFLAIAILLGVGALAILETMFSKPKK